MRLRHLFCFALLLPAIISFAGCGTGGSIIATENDRLRAQVMELEGQVKTLTSRNSELQTQLAQALQRPDAVGPEIAENTPFVTSIALNRLSHARDSDGDGKMDSITLFLEPADGLGRFLQIVGSVSMHAAILPADGPAKTIGQKTLTPKEVREGYRSAFTGQYYSMTLPIDPPPLAAPRPMPPVSGATTAPATRPADPASQCTVRVEYTDGYTGQKFSTERVIDLR